MNQLMVLITLLREGDSGGRRSYVLGWLQNQSEHFKLFYKMTIVPYTIEKSIPITGKQDCK